jgi:hypothetical protein
MNGEWGGGGRGEWVRRIKKKDNMGMEILYLFKRNYKVFNIQRFLLILINIIMIFLILNISFAFIFFIYLMYYLAY